MDNNRKVVIRGIIEKRIAELEQLLASGNDEDATRSQQLHDEATRLDALANLSVDSTLLARAQADLVLLRRQRLRIEHEEFGLCRQCGEQIAANRIATVPATDLCIACAQQQEKRQ